MRSKKFPRLNFLESRFSLGQFSLPSPPHSHWIWEVYHIDRLPSLSLNTVIILTKVEVQPKFHTCFLIALFDFILEVSHLWRGHPSRKRVRAWCSSWRGRSMAPNLLHLSPMQRNTSKPCLLLQGRAYFLSQAPCRANQTSLLHVWWGILYHIIELSDTTHERTFLKKFWIFHTY